MKAQLWLDTYYPPQKRRETLALYLSKGQGVGSVDLTEFIKLQELYIENEQLDEVDLSCCENLTKLIVCSGVGNLDLTNNRELTYIEIKDNNYRFELSMFSHLTKLQHLDLTNSNFGGSLKLLENCKNLVFLAIAHNKRIEFGLEYLPAGISLDCKGTILQERLKSLGADVDVWKTYHKQQQLLLEERRNSINSDDDK